MNIEDRELLELAAKAAFGVRPALEQWGVPPGLPGVFVHEGRTWNPLEDDGDALRLAVRLGMLATYSGERFELFQAAYRQCLDEDMKPSEATRGGIVRAAAEIGRRIP